MEEIAKRVIENVAFKLMLILEKSIRDNVYLSHSPNKVYYDGSRQPTFEFLSAWKFTDITKELTKELYYDWQSMSYDPDTFLHGSNIPGWYPDARKYLADFLNKEGLSSSHWISKERHPYWDLFINEADRKMGRFFDEEMSKFGARRI